MKAKKVSVGLTLLLCFIIAGSLIGCRFKEPDEKKLLDLTAYELVFSDEFDTLNTDVWWSGDDGIRRGGYWDIGQVKAENGNLIITTEYRDGKHGTGWYTGSVYTKGKRQFLNGYAEARCILPKGSGLWGAFWLQSPDMEKGKNGAEIDVVEGPYYNDPYTFNASKFKNTAFHTIHSGGYGESHVAKQSPYYKISDPYNEYHTYGVAWDENGYTFYVDGKQTWQTDFYPTTEEEYLWLSVEISGEYGSADPVNPKNKFIWAGEIEANGKDFISQFTVDFVRVYQKKGA